jgi:hypothetical protein
MDREVTVRTWWRWVLRGLAVVALAIGAVLLFAQPTASETLRVPGSTNPVTVGCSSPFEQFQGNVFWTSQPLQPTTETGPDTYALRCESAASDREHIVAVLGAGGVVLVGLSFLRRRRPVVTVPVNPSVL